MTSKKPINKGPKNTQRIPNPALKRLYDLKSAAEYLGRPVWGVRELIWAGKLPIVRDGRKQYVDVYDLDRFIERNKLTVL